MWCATTDNACPWTQRTTTGLSMLDVGSPRGPARCCTPSYFLQPACCLIRDFFEEEKKLSALLVCVWLQCMQMKKQTSAGAVRTAEAKPLTTITQRIAHERKRDPGSWNVCPCRPLVQLVRYAHEREKRALLLRLFARGPAQQKRT